MHSVDRHETAGEDISSQAIAEQPEITNIDSTATVVTPSKANDTSAAALDGLRSYLERCSPDLSNRVSEFRCEVRYRTGTTRSDKYFFHNSQEGYFRSYVSVLRFLQNLEKEGSSSRAVAEQPNVVDYDEETGEPFWEVKRIEDARLVDTWEVKVKWMGCNEMIWEPLCNVTKDELREEARRMIEEKKLNKVVGCKDGASRVVAKQPDVVDRDETAEPLCEVDRIEDVRPVDTWEVKVKWVGFTRMTWEPLYHLSNNELEEEARRKIEEKKVGMQSRKGGKRPHPRTGSHADPLRGAKRQKQGHIILPALAFGGLPIDDINLGSQTKPKKQSLLSYLFGGGHRIVSVTKNLVNTPLRLEGVATFNGAKLVLVAIKIIDSKGFHKFGKQKKLRFFYVAAENGVEYVQQKLEGVADFRSLAVHKRISRLKHLLTDGDLFDHFSADKFEQIEETGHNGCGFMPEETLRQMYPRRPWVSAIQVRFVIPHLGFAKGLLVAKQGISKIQVPSSMIKILPRMDKAGIALLLVCGVFPSTPNRYFGKFLDDASTEQLPESFEKGIKKLSPMYSHLLEGLGVPARIVKDYARAACKLKGREHASFVGVTDPTGFLPPGKIFITGPKRNLAGERKEVLITRSPCLEPSDMKLMPVCENEDDLLPASKAVGDYQSVSSVEAWSELCELPFGLIIFPLNQMLPDQIAEGDLDGDLYVLFWSSKILSRVRKTEDLCCDATKLPPEPKTLQSHHTDNSNNWLKETHAEMLKYETVRHKSELIGALYNKCQDTGKKSKHHAYDQDARAYARACKDAIDSGKHDCSVRLPKRLHSGLKERLHPFLTNCSDKDRSVAHQD